MNNQTSIGLIGLGRMGQAIAYRLVKNNIKVFAYDPNIEKINLETEVKDKIFIEKDIKSLITKTNILWLMVPAGNIIDDILDKLINLVNPETIIIDGGNSFYKDTVKRYKKLKEKNINYLDCGTSGGLHGKDLGFSLMIGGDKDIFEKVENIFKTIAHPNGYNYMGQSGAGHYVKMVHNGIEYSLLQAYAEGFDLLKNNNNYKNLDLEKICSTWKNGSIIRSWILNLSEQIFKQDQELKNISGAIEENKTGYWTLEEAKEQKIEMKLLQDSLDIRKWSRLTGGNYSTKVVAMLRNKFGGHKIETI